MSELRYGNMPAVGLHPAWRWLGLSLIIVALDQITKGIATRTVPLYEQIPVLPSLNFTLVHNPGAAFSFLGNAGGWQRWLFVALALLAGIIIVRMLFGLARGQSGLGCGLALVLGGALGNLWDRLILGYVIDFIDVYLNHWHWPAFNVADSAITIGAVILIVDGLRRE